MSEVKKFKQQLDAVVMKSNTSNPGSKEALALVLYSTTVVDVVFLAREKSLVG